MKLTYVCITSYEIESLGCLGKDETIDIFLYIVTKKIKFFKNIFLRIEKYQSPKILVILWLWSTKNYVSAKGAVSKAHTHKL